MKSFTLRSWLCLALLCIGATAMAQTVLLEEDFSGCTSTQPDNPSTTLNNPDAKFKVAGWTVVKAYEGEGNVKLGASSSAGSITTPELDLSDASATYTLSFRACAWSGDTSSLLVTVDDQEAVEVTGLTNSGAPYAANLKEFSLDVTGTAQSKITIASKSASKCRLFIDDIKVTKLSAGEVAAPSVVVPAMVAFGSVKSGTNAEQDVKIAGADLTGDLTVAVAGEGFACATITIAKDEAAEAVVKVTFAPTADGPYEGTLTISGGGLAEAVVVTLTGEGVALEGEGTQENPYTIADVQKLNNPGTTAWVKGFIVGYASGTSLANGSNFTTEGAVATNMLIAASVDEQDYTNCVPVALPANSAARTELNLLDNPLNLGREVLVYGTLTAYFSVQGVKDVSDHVLLANGNEDVPVVSLPTTLDFGTLGVGNAVVKTVTVAAANLTGDLTVSIEGYGYTCDVTTISQDATSTTLTITLTPTEAGTYEGTLTISGGGLAENAVMDMEGEAVAFTGNGTLENPYTCADILVYIAGLESGVNSTEDVYIKGKVVSITGNYDSSSYGNATFNISDDGTEASTFLVYRAMYLENVAYPEGSELLKVGDEVVIYGKVVNYKGNTPETVSGKAYLYSLNGKTTNESEGDNIAAVTADNAPVEVYTLDGKKVETGLKGLRRGVYIVKSGDVVRKKVIK